MTRIDFFIAVAAVALLAAFIILLLTKLGIVERVQVHGLNSKRGKINDIFSELANCHFCLSFWTAVLISAVAVALTGEPYLMFVPIFSTPLTRFML